MVRASSRPPSISHRSAASASRAIRASGCRCRAPRRRAARPPGSWHGRSPGRPSLVGGCRVDAVPSVQGWCSPTAAVISVRASSSTPGADSRYPGLGRRHGSRGAERVRVPVPRPARYRPPRPRRRSLPARGRPSAGGRMGDSRRSSGSAVCPPLAVAGLGPAPRAAIVACPRRESRPPQVVGGQGLRMVGAQDLGVSSTAGLGPKRLGVVAAHRRSGMRVMVLSVWVPLAQRSRPRASAAARSGPPWPRRSRAPGARGTGFAGRAGPPYRPDEDAAPARSAACRGEAPPHTAQAPQIGRQSAIATMAPGASCEGAPTGPALPPPRSPRPRATGRPGGRTTKRPSSPPAPRGPLGEPVPSRTRRSAPGTAGP